FFASRMPACSSLTRTRYDWKSTWTGTGSGAANAHVSARLLRSTDVQIALGSSSRCSIQSAVTIYDHETTFGATLFGEYWKGRADRYISRPKSIRLSSLSATRG